MPRASWKGFLRLSLVSCPVYPSPATTRTKSIRLNQMWVPSARQAEPSEAEDEEAPPPRAAGRSSRGEPDTPEDEWEEPAGPATRIALQPVARDTGEAIERDEVLKGYEFERGQYVTFTPAELKALDVESSKTIDLTTFVPREEIDPRDPDTPRRSLRPLDLPRPLPGGAARTDRGEDARAAGQGETDRGAAPGRQSHGGSEAQPGAGDG